MSIKADNLIWRIGRKTVIDDVSFEAQPKKMLGVLGPGGNTSGKATRLQLVQRHRPVDQREDVLPVHPLCNLDAKLEMARDPDAQAKELAPGIYERAFPLPSNLVKPRPAHTPPDDPPLESAVIG